MKNLGFTSAPMLLIQGMGTSVIIIILLMASSCSPVAPSIEKKSMLGISQQTLLNDSNLQVQDIDLSAQLITQGEYKAMKPELKTALELSPDYSKVFSEKGAVGISLPSGFAPKAAYVVVNASESAFVSNILALADQDLDESDVQKVNLQIHAQISDGKSAHSLRLIKDASQDEAVYRAIKSELKRSLGTVVLVF